MIITSFRLALSIQNMCTWASPLALAHMETTWASQRLTAQYTSTIHTRATSQYTVTLPVYESSKYIAPLTVGMPMLFPYALMPAVTPMYTYFGCLTPAGSLL